MRAVNRRIKQLPWLRVSPYFSASGCSKEELCISRFHAIITGPRVRKARASLPSSWVFQSIECSPCSRCTRVRCPALGSRARCRPPPSDASEMRYLKKPGALGSFLHDFLMTSRVFLLRGLLPARGVVSDAQPERGGGCFPGPRGAEKPQPSVRKQPGALQTRPVQSAAQERRTKSTSHFNVVTIFKPVP